MMCLVVLCVLCCVQGVFEVCVERGLVLAEIGEGVSLEEVRAATGASFQVYTVWTSGLVNIFLISAGFYLQVSADLIIMGQV